MRYGGTFSSCVVRVARRLRSDPLLTTLLILYVGLTLISHGKALLVWRVVDYDSLLTLYALMIISRGLELTGFFVWLANNFFSLTRRNVKAFLILFVISSSLTAALIMNDAAVFVYAPLISAVSKLSGISVEDMAVLLAISVNIGSSLTPMGNPQNIIIWRAFNVSLQEFIAMMAPFFLVGVGLLLIYSINVRPKSVSLPPPPEVRINLGKVAAYLALLAASVWGAQEGLSLWVFLAVATASIALERLSLLNIDLRLMLSFALIFGNFTYLAEAVKGLISPSLLCNPLAVFITSASLSQVVSNVPASLLLLPLVREWIPLALGVNVGGVGTVISSMANLITSRLTGVPYRTLQKRMLPYFLMLLAVTAGLLAVGFWR